MKLNSCIKSKDGKITSVTRGKDLKIFKIGDRILNSWKYEVDIENITVETNSNTNKKEFYLRKVNHGGIFLSEAKHI